MFDPAGFPAAEMQFDKDAKVVGTTDDVVSLATDKAITDLIVMSHGWNNDMADARSLYTQIATSMRAVIDGDAVADLADHHIGLAVLYWPSKKFADTDLIPGGAAAAVSPTGITDVRDAIDHIRDLFPDPAQQAALDQASGLVAELEDRATARKTYATLLRSLLNPAAAELEDGDAELFNTEPGTLMDRLAVPATIAPPRPIEGGALNINDTEPRPGGAVGGAAGLFSTLGGALGAAKNLLNYLTYYQMKARAGLIGENCLAPLATGIHQNRDELRIHFVGHSFGGRLVSAAATHVPANTLASVMLLQAAFSHYGFSAQWSPGHAGGFRNTVADRAVSGPILITHTANDHAVGIAYALASRLAGQNASGVGDADDIYGGIGRNGAQKTDEAAFGELLDVGSKYTWADGSIHNLQADAFIKNHSDVKGQQVAYAILSAAASN
jgi:hypothetical protein